MAYFYVTYPIDFWSGWQQPHQVFKSEKNSFEKHRKDDWEPIWKKAKWCGEQTCWEGDISEGPYVTVLPIAEGVLAPIIIGWKQSNNGTTFIYSEERLEFLEADFTYFVNEDELEQE